uniref:CUB domain-containing protein n=1 Tax=Strongyloides papillosus TaxID=174720 RepID=A0A0N5B3A7_STREA
MVFIRKMIIFLEFIFLINAYSRFKTMQIKENYLMYRNVFNVQHRSFDINTYYLQDCRALINKKGIYGTKSAQDNKHNNCVVSISTPTMDDIIYIKFITSNIICKYYPNFNMNLTLPEKDEKVKIDYCSTKKHLIPTFYKEALLEYTVIGLPVKFKVEFFPLDPVCGSKIQKYQIGKILTLRKPLDFKEPCTLILPGNSVIKILNYNLNLNNYISCLRLYDGRFQNEKIIKKKEICSNNLTVERENDRIFDIACSQGELIIDASKDYFNLENITCNLQYSFDNTNTMKKGRLKEMNGKYFANKLSITIVNEQFLYSNIYGVNFFKNNIT